MFKKVLLVFIIILFSISLINCSNQGKGSSNTKGTAQTSTSSNSQNKSGNQQDIQKKSTTENKLTIEDIKAKYTGGDSGKIVNTITYMSKYILVEYSTDDTIGHCFDFYNLKTGDKDTLPIYALHVKLDKIVNENDIRFICDGTNNINGHKSFPEIVECLRGQEVTGYDGEFYQVIRSYYLPIVQGVEVGAKPYETIADLNVSLKGVEVLFEPMKGHEDYFTAAYVSVPFSKAFYDKAKNQFVIEFKNTDIDNKFNISKINGQNRYLSSISIKRSGSNTVLTINLKDTAKYYAAIESNLEPVIDGDFPCLDFNFASEFKIE
ncbi:MAG: hypothetical protein G4V63_00245 [Candidatus Afipia apatlaquensis]|uniref:Uncharacterized protein n=1 Tax=Candidatus Afipia apatlaquensis TaxID=2712852 RepID=A0A7C9RCF0_9BRAD|nr:hypothetical protein [Candidatus Afipia apatlaquensis]